MANIATGNNSGWLVLSTPDKTYEIPVLRPQLFEWWTNYQVIPCTVEPCRGACNQWFPATGADNDTLLILHGLHPKQIRTR